MSTILKDQAKKPHSTLLVSQRALFMDHIEEGQRVSVLCGTQMLYIGTVSAVGEGAVLLEISTGFEQETSEVVIFYEHIISVSVEIPKEKKS